MTLARDVRHVELAKSGIPLTVELLLAAPLITSLPLADAPARTKVAADSSPSRSSPVWSVLTLTGLVFLFVGLVDVGLAWFVPRFGNVDWEFATVSATLNNLPVPTLGFALLLAGAAGSGSRGQLAALAVAALLGVLLLIGAGVLYALTVPIALEAVQQPMQRQTLRIALIKGVSSLIAYLAFYVACVIVGIRARRAVAG